MKKLFELIKCDLRIFIREPMGGAFIILFTTIIMFSNYLFDPSGNYVCNVLAGTIGLTIMSATLKGGAITIGISRETNVLKRYRISNTKSWMIFISVFTVQMFLTIIATVLQLTIAALLFHIKVLDIKIGAFILDYIVSSILLFSIGLFISSSIRSMKNLHGVASLIFTIMMLLGGSAFPVERMPAIMQKIVLALPLTHVNANLYQDLVAIGKSDGIFYIYAGVFVVLYLALGIKNFRWEVEQY